MFSGLERKRVAKKGHISSQLRQSMRECVEARRKLYGTDHADIVDAMARLPTYEDLPPEESEETTLKVLEWRGK